MSNIFDSHAHYDDPAFDLDREELLDELLDCLRWFGFEWDEGPSIGGDFGSYFQNKWGGSMKNNLMF